MHCLNIKPNVKLVKQQQWRFCSDIMEAIEAEVHKLIECGFIREDKHLDWVTNIVPILKKNEKIWLCIDYCDLNAACPKDEFPLPITDSMIENTCGFQRMSFMVASQGTIKSRCTQKMKGILHFGHHWGYTVIMLCLSS